MDKLKIGETKEVEVKICGPGVVIIEDTEMLVFGAEDIDGKVNCKLDALDDTYYSYRIDGDDENKLFALVNAVADEEDFFEPYRATLKRIR